MQSKCRCCLKQGRHKDMWAEYVSDGGVEIYGEMLIECFQFSWPRPEEYIENICDQCIEKLRMSLYFRREVLSSVEAWPELIENDSENKEGVLKVKLEENDGHDAEIEEYEYQDDIPTNTEHGDSEEETQELVELDDDGDPEYLPCDSEDEDVEEDMEVEYLEDDLDVKSVIEKQRLTTSKYKKYKYKKYSTRDLDAALQMITEQKMGKAEASLKFNVPIKTLSFKLNEDESKRKDKQNKFYEEIRTILEYTNATPYKTKVGRLFCAYCPSDYPMFETPDELRAHTLTKHGSERLDVEIFMRPNYLNEVIKLDIENLQCIQCDCPIVYWNSMFEHLKEKHEVELDLAYTKVIPYVLTEDISCCLCKQKFSHFHLLDIHMNSHYNNYICGECGETYLSESRLKKHAETHSTKRLPCSMCSKTFSLEKYRKKHMDGVHLKELRFKCIYCLEVFAQDYTRHLHVLEKHNEKVKLLQCEYCKQDFTWRPYYLKHIRLVHKRPEKKFKCKLCPKTFRLRSELKNHEDWHSGNGYTCPVCQRKFASKNYLQKHITVHFEETVGSVDTDNIEVHQSADETPCLESNTDASVEVITNE